MKLFVLIACEESQAECKAFRLLGHEAFSCDIQKCRRNGNPDWHIQGDVTPYLTGTHSFITQSGKKVTVPRWDLIIAHPPCTFLCRASAKQMYGTPDTYVMVKDKRYAVNGNRYKKMIEGRNFFYSCLHAQAKYVAVENPIPLTVAQLPKPTTFACPSWFGYKYTKKTCYWLKNLPPLMAEIINPLSTCLVLSTRGKYRSQTADCLAKAIAKQWSNYIDQTNNT